MSRTLRIGDRGSDVRAVQDVLNFHIRRLAPLVVDGRFGTETQGRVREFQRANRLAIDGVVKVVGRVPTEAEIVTLLMESRVPKVSG